MIEHIKYLLFLYLDNIKIILDNPPQSRSYDCTNCRIVYTEQKWASYLGVFAWVSITIALVFLFTWLGIIAHIVVTYLAGCLVFNWCRDNWGIFVEKAKWINTQFDQLYEWSKPTKETEEND